MKLLPLNATLRKYKCKLRLNNKDTKQTEWANWVMTTDGVYLETSCTEPVNVNKIQNIEVDVFATPRTGRMASVSDSDYLKNIKAELDKNEISYNMAGSNLLIEVEDLL